jgi:mycothiol system anti-sigma-R factor
MTKPSLQDMSCEEVAKAVWTYLDGEIDAERVARIRAHLETCGHCRDLFTFEGAFLRTVSRLLDAPADDTASLRSRVVHALADAGLTLPR